MFRLFLLSLTLLLGISALSLSANANSTNDIRTVSPVATQALAIKSERMVIFYDADQNEIGRFPAVFGQARGPKRYEGDLRTPEGDYWLAPARASSEWGWFMPISYPNDDDIRRARAEGRPVEKLGNSIGMHAAGDGFLRNVRQSFGENWTFGCIAVTDNAMSYIRPMVQQPIPIRIQP